jgi:hypothetical protein
VKDFITQYKKARAASTPLLAISTPDPAATIQGIVKASTNGNSVPLIQWDCVSGAQGINETGAKEIERLCQGKDFNPCDVTNPVELLILANGLDSKSVLFMLNGHQYFDQPTFVQAFWNLRDVFSNKQCSVILLGPSFMMPPELQQDTLLLDEPLPNAEQLRGIVSGLATRNKIPHVTDETLNKAVDALRGLAAFPADQITAMSASKKDGLDVDGMWERKRQMINETPGLSVHVPNPDDAQCFDDLGGLDQIKGFMRRLLKGKSAIRCVVFFDEIEKSLAGASGLCDSSGVSQGQHELLLTTMQNERYPGLIFLGPPGAAKSALAKVVGAEAGIPTIVCDMNAMKDSLVGSSEARLRHAMKIIHAVGDGCALFIATCNRISGLSPELRRRFKRGTFFFDLPTAEERKAIWKIYIKRYKLTPEQTKGKVEDEGWTGAEVESCVEMANDFGCSLAEASQYVVPVVRSAADEIAKLRDQADGKFLSASLPGTYTKPMKLAQTATSNVGRTIAEEN